MIKFFFILLFIFLLQNCSTANRISIPKINEEKKNIDITKLNFDNKRPYNEFKKNIIIYGKYSNFPSLD